MYGGAIVARRAEKGVFAPLAYSIAFAVDAHVLVAAEAARAVQRRAVLLRGGGREQRERKAAHDTTRVRTRLRGCGLLLRPFK